MAGEGWRCLEMAGGGWRWLKMAGDGWRVFFKFFSPLSKILKILQHTVLMRCMLTTSFRTVLSLLFLGSSTPKGALRVQGFRFILQYFSRSTRLKHCFAAPHSRIFRWSRSKHAFLLVGVHLISGHSEFVLTLIITRGEGIETSDLTVYLLGGY